MLKRFFTPKWQHNDDTVRELALNSLNISNDMETITKMATDDPSDKIREIALSKISDVVIIESLLSRASNPTDWCRYAFKLNTLSSQIERITAQFIKAKIKWNEDETFQAVASHVSSQELTNSLLLATNDPDILFKIATTAKSINLRLKAIEEINDLELLSQLSKVSTQKQVLQVVRSRLTDAKSHQKTVSDTIAGAERLVIVLEKLSQQSWFDSQFEAKVNFAVEHWRELDLEIVEGASDSKKNELMECITNFERFFKNCQQLITENKNELEQAAAKQDALEKQKALCSQLQSLVKEMSDPAMNTVASYQSVKYALELLNSNWQQTIKESQPIQKVSNTYQQFHKQLQMSLLPWEKFIRSEMEIGIFFTTQPDEQYEALKLWLEHWQKIKTDLAWVNGSTLPALLNDWYELAGKYKIQYDKIMTEQKKKARYINQKMMLLEKHCQQRNLIAANKLVNYINQKLNDSISDFRVSLSKKLESILPQLNDLRDWHAFATGPKKNELCEQMEKLIDESNQPLTRAKKVRELQQQWRELLASDPNADDQLWERFKQASDVAYLPCLNFYAEKDKARADNLKKRIEICESLEQVAITNGWCGKDSNDLKPVEELISIGESESEAGSEILPAVNTGAPDWKGIDKLVSKTSREWKSYQPVPENERETVQKQFNTILFLIKKQLDAEKQSNLELRCELVKKAVDFHELDDVEKAIQGVLYLQKQWKELGLTFYKADREQWHLFRDAIDKVFAKRNIRKKEFKNELQNNQHELKNITKEISLLCELDDQVLKASHTRYEELKDSWNHEKELPRSSSQSLLNSFNDTCNRYLEHYSGLGKRQKEMAFISLFQGVNLLQSIEERMLSDKLNEIDENELEGLKDKLSQLQYDEAGKRLIDDRFSQLGSDVVIIENQAGLEQLQSLVLAMEILLSIDSPESFKEQRVAIQLEQLQKGFGSTRTDVDKKKEVLSMVDTWVSVGFINHTERAQLESRRVAIFTAVGL